VRPGPTPYESDGVDSIDNGIFRLEWDAPVTGNRRVFLERRLIQLDAKSWGRRWLDVPVFDLDDARIEEKFVAPVCRPEVVVGWNLWDTEVGKVSREVQRCRGRDRSVWIVWRNFDVPGLGQRCDLLQLADPADMNDVRLNRADELTFEQGPV